MKAQNTITLKTAEQIRVNIIVIDNYDKAIADLADYARMHDVPSKRLRLSCADVLETDNYYLLRSYSTIVAVIDKSTSICYDALRHVYGYTATSAQHIHKFCVDYGVPTYARYVYRKV